MYTAQGYPSNLTDLMRHISQPRLQEYIRRFLYDVLNPAAVIPGADVSIHDCLMFSGRVRVCHLAVSIYYAPSDVCGIGGMHRKIIQSTRSWYKGPERRDTVFVVKDQEQDGFQGLDVARVMLFFDFTFLDTVYPCALVEWFTMAGQWPCDTAGMWIVKPDMIRGWQVTSVIHLDTILHGAHLMPIFSNIPLPRQFTYHYTLSAFHSYYVNKYINHHSHKIAF